MNYPSLIEVEITSEDFKKSWAFSDPYCCPLAIALTRMGYPIGMRKGVVMSTCVKFWEVPSVGYYIPATDKWGGYISKYPASKINKMIEAAKSGIIVGTVRLTLIKSIF